MDILSFKNKSNLDCLKCFNKQLSSNIEEMNAFGLSKLYKELKAQRENFKAFLDGFDTFDDKEFLLSLQEFYSWDAEKLLIEYNCNV